MTNVFVGFQNNQKNCRRSLKPPGGGTSDFFNFASITDEPKKPDTTTEVQQNEKTVAISPTTEIKVESKEVENGKAPTTELDGSEAPVDDKICKGLNDLTVDQICEIEDNEEGSKKDSVEVKTVGTGSTTVKSSITMTSSSTRSEVISEKQAVNRVPPGGHSKGLW